LVLAAVLGEFAGPEAVTKGAEATPGVDRRKLPVIADQDRLGPGPLGVVEQATKLAAAHHAGLIHHQHRPPLQPLPTAIQVGQQPIAGGHLLEPLTLQTDRRDAGRGTGEQPVAVQLPGMPGRSQGEGLARPGPPHNQGDAGAALADVPDHGLLVLPGGGMRLQRSPHRVMGDHGRLLVGAAGGGDDQPLLHRQQLGGGPAALL
jgi:hypothetical protein